MTSLTYPCSIQLWASVIFPTSQFIADQDIRRHSIPSAELTPRNQLSSAEPVIRRPLTKLDTVTTNNSPYSEYMFPVLPCSDLVIYQDLYPQPNSYCPNHASPQNRPLRNSTDRPMATAPLSPKHQNNIACTLLNHWHHSMMYRISRPSSWNSPRASRLAHAHSSQPRLPRITTSHIHCQIPRWKRYFRDVMVNQKYPEARNIPSEDLLGQRGH
ncbi:hypothetical protein EJ06DRAFT_119655 [Trichodelitschia bisporula]|uniref:Uncharacterized protein n=1 Tax=Trichodelitschia bisporula TaxID=703511 RepID=A0A6G1HQJ0_9PEZI|nr:hypothetical protein EJ06DRAFT_119655 [Trichodelitschia bisporula]